MAADTPDARSIESWEEVFCYPVPTARRIERELRHDVVSNREKLRSLVGVRYRDLLDTAQRIMVMNEEIKKVEQNLSGITIGCNSVAISRKCNELRKLQGVQFERVSSDRTFAAHLTLFTKCVSAISRLLHHGCSIAVSSKLMVISRILHNTLCQSKKAVPYVERLWSRLGYLRRTLLKHINVQLASHNLPAQDIVKSLSAYCLTTSSSAEDAYRYFHDIRQEEIGRQIGKNGSVRHNLLSALALYMYTLQNTVELLGGQFFTTLENLTSSPLLDDPAVRVIGELEIGTLYPWISKEIRNFKPWIKHDRMSKQTLEMLVNSWSKIAFDNLVTRAKSKLKCCENFQELLSIRKCLLEKWLPAFSSIPCYSSTDVLDKIRRMINEQLITVIQLRNNELDSVGEAISSAMTKWPDVSTFASKLWEPEFVFADTSDGATRFKLQLVDRVQGHDSCVLHVLDAYKYWLNAVINRSSMIQELRNLKWEDVLDDDVEEELSETICDYLSDDDPHILQNEQIESLLKSYKSLEIVLKLAAERKSPPHQLSQTAFLLRITRSIRENSPDQVAITDYSFAQSLVPSLHSILAEKISSQSSLSTIGKSLLRHRTRCAGRSLWEGDEPLPVLPSQATFKILQQLVLSMEQEGPDLWTPAAISALKRDMLDRIGTVVMTNYEKLLSTAELGQARQSVQQEQESHKSSLRDHKIQLLFDLLYLRSALSCNDKSASKQSLKKVVDVVHKDLKLSGDSMDILGSRSHEYWLRTRLLFGLLG
ncbi:hypothetical protein LOZ53_000490 [Ophidiomyces ophidiicola]|nr:hypothetical protein LOZ54_005957 [Ophidiomyces ophidiicola]KAI1981343.1 hypothetical protein LOZ55_000842 [Ophidiomyces ophidiicola]KAI1997483.1 hypothetical protein LOZ53_000490 [Ophidiomyces ophidiicola]KAI1997996.1 hypothetical protein LOZ51_002670 [Ophidiomyces ophidiicola]